MLSVEPDACRDSGNRRAWLAAVMDLSAQTVAYIPYDELAPLWRTIEASGCYVGSTPAERIWPDFLHAVARRDRPEIIRLGTVLLHGQTVRARSDELGMVLTAVAASLHGSGRLEAAGELLRAWSPLLGDGDPHALAIQILAAAALAG
jgi:hypothetical protein